MLYWCDLMTMKIVTIAFVCILQFTVFSINDETSRPLYVFCGMGSATPYIDHFGLTRWYLYTVRVLVCFDVYMLSVLCICTSHGYCVGTLEIMPGIWFMCKLLAFWSSHLLNRAEYYFVLFKPHSRIQYEWDTATFYERLVYVIVKNIRVISLYKCMYVKVFVVVFLIIFAWT